MIKKIRKSSRQDVARMLEIFDSAKKYMVATGNPNQWSGPYPTFDDIMNDIREGVSYVGLNEKDEIVMTFVFIVGEDPTYSVITDGEWLNDEPYGTIHRIASDGSERGVVDKTCEFCFRLTQNIRIDTHEDNKPMQRALNNLGFSKCGTIICRNGTPRVAFQKKIRI